MKNFLLVLLFTFHFTLSTFGVAEADIRLKNVGDTYLAGISEIMKLNPVRYHYKKDNPAGISDTAEHVGLVAQEVQAAIPEAVAENKQGYLMLNTDPLIFAMINAIKQQQSKIEELQREIESLRDDISDLKALGR